MLDDHVAGLLRQRRHKPAKQRSRRRRAEQLSDDEARRVGRPDSGEGIGRGASQRHRWIGE